MCRGVALNPQSTRARARNGLLWVPANRRLPGVDRPASNFGGTPNQDGIQRQQLRPGRSLITSRAFIVEMRPADLVLLIVAFASPAAFAECAASAGFLEPGSGPLPRHAVVHLFVPSYYDEAPRIDVRGESGRILGADVQQLDSPGAFRIWRISFDASEESVVTVGHSIGSREPTLRTIFPIERAQEREGVSRSVRVESLSESFYYWTCSAEMLQRLSVDVAAPVYRIEWAPSEDAFLRGDRKRFLLPHRTDAGYWGKDASAPPSLALDFLGEFEPALQPNLAPNLDYVHEGRGIAAPK